MRRVSGETRIVSRPKAVGALALAASMLGIVSHAQAQANCPAPGSCFVDHSTPGCNLESCCQVVCAADAFCCERQWDSICVNLATSLCVTTCEPACDKLNVECLNPSPAYDNSRFVAQLRVPPGNQDPLVPENPDGFCTAWIIAQPDIMLTNAHCNPQVGQVVAFEFECNQCVDGVVKPTENFTITQIVACDVAEDWCLFRVNGNVSAMFGQARIDPSPIEVGAAIYEIHHAEKRVKGYDDGVVTATFLNPDCPGGIPEHAVSVIASPGASGSPVFDANTHCVVGVCNCGPPCAPGFMLPMSTIWPSIESALPSLAVVQLCDGLPCESSDHNCFTIGGSGCTDLPCCYAVCAMDPACCDNLWDGVCVSEAVALCDGCGDPGAGDCCAAHATPYCAERTCCELVCGSDPFCCEEEWDTLCAEAANALPECGCVQDPCETSEESCFVAHGTPGCDDPDCCEIVCATDPFCCAMEWDELCKDEANGLCGNCGSPEAGCCFAPQSGVGCNSASCCRAVCEADPFCCEVSWDSLCAAGASDLCAACRADLNGDGVVGGADLAQVLGAWGTADACANLDGVGVVDGADLALLLGDWGPC